MSFEYYTMFIIQYNTIKFIMKESEKISPGRKDKKQQILNHFVEFLPDWKQTNLNQVTLQRMAGITNQTYKVQREGQPNAYIYRQFGDASDNIFLNRQTEEFVYQFISDNKAGPQIYGMTQDVRIEQFIPSKVLKTKDMLTTPIVEDLAFALRRFHQISPKSQKLPKKSLFQHIFFNKESPILQKCYSKMQKPIFTQTQQKILKDLRSWVSPQQIEFIKKISAPLSTTNLVFSHNDLLAGNVLIREGDNKIIFIDYEYSCYNYQVYDIANYFNQCVYDYDVKQAPYFKILELTEQQQNMKDRFIRCYAMAEEKDYFIYKDKVKNKAQLGQQAKEVEKRVKQHLRVGQMLSNMMWGYWAIIVSKNPQIDFDYISFAEVRHKLYQELKTEYLKTNK